MFWPTLDHRWDLWTLFSFPTSLMWVWMMQSSICCRMLTLIWIVEVALYFFISHVPSIPSNPFRWGKAAQDGCQYIYCLLGCWLSVRQVSVWSATEHPVWCGGTGGYRGPQGTAPSPFPFTHCTPQIFSTILSHATCRSSLMTMVVGCIRDWQESECR